MTANTFAGSVLRVRSSTRVRRFSSKGSSPVCFQVLTRKRRRFMTALPWSRKASDLQAPAVCVRERPSALQRRSVDTLSRTWPDAKGSVKPRREIRHGMDNRATDSSFSPTELL